MQGRCSMWIAETTRAARLDTGLRACVLVGVTACGALAGCGREEVHSYRVPKSAETQEAVPSAVARTDSREVNPELPPRGAPTSTNEVVVTWDVPASWKVVPTEQPMRLATYEAFGAEVTVSAFPGAAGGVLSNVNRWRGQIGLAPTDASALASSLIASSVNGVEIATLTLTGSEGQVMLGAIIVPGDGKSWFVKSTTDAAKAAALLPSFESFAKSFRREAAQAAVTANMPATVPTQPTKSPSVGASIEERLARFQPPSHWAIEANSGGIVAAAFGATNASGVARATVTSLANDGGGDLANINRWREQLGLAALADLTLVERVDFGPEAIVVDLTNPDATDRMIAAIVATEQATWFFKLRGSIAAVEAERAPFRDLVRSVGLGLEP